MTKSINTLLFVLLGFLFSCDNPKLNDNDTVLARVHDTYLYQSDIQGIIPINSSPTDSLMIVKSYINNWIRKQLTVMLAEANLSDEEKDFSKQLEAYRSSLITYKYESLLIQQNLDTIVNNEEIETYYEENKNNFQLKSNIVKVDYVKFNKDSRYNNRIKRLIQTRDTNQVLLDSLRYYCESISADYIIDSDQWILFDDLLKLVPINTYNQEVYLRNHTFVEFVDDLVQYYVNFLDFSIKNDLSPLGFEKENIKRIILNRRKGELINKMHNDIFEQALNNNAIEIF
jgi:hypothetical protein